MEMARAIFIPDLLFGSGRVGSYELGREQKATFITGLMGIADDIFGYINRYIIKQLTQLNFGDLTKAPKLRYMPLSKVSEDAYAEIVKTLITKGAIFPDLETLSEKMGIPLEKAKVQDINADTKKSATPKPNRETTQKQMGRIERYLQNVLQSTDNPQTIEHAINGLKIGYKELYPEGYEEMESEVKDSIMFAYRRGEPLAGIMESVGETFGLKSKKSDNTLKIQVQTMSDETAEKLEKKLDETVSVQKELLKENQKEKRVIVGNAIVVKNPVHKVEVSNIKEAKSYFPPVVVKTDKKTEPDSVKTIKAGGKVVEIVEKYGEKEVRYKVNKTASGNELKKV
jgi:hypothetical protein